MTIYPAKVNSPLTTLASAINDTVTTIPLVNASVVPDGPNLATIGLGEDAETVLYGGKTGNNLISVTRGFQGTQKAWAKGTHVARVYTAYDHDTFKSSIEGLEAGDIGEIHLTPKLSSSGPEGTLFYASDDDHVYVGTE